MTMVSNTAMILGALTLATIAATYVLVALRWRSTPAPVPRHFDLRGRPDASGGKWILWFNPSFALVFAVGMVLLGIVAKGEAGGTEEEFAWATGLLAGSSMLIAVLMLVFTERSIAIARKRATGLGWSTLLCVVITLVVLCLVVFVWSGHAP